MQPAQGLSSPKCRTDTMWMWQEPGHASLWILRLIRTLTRTTFNSPSAQGTYCLYNLSILDLKLGSLKYESRKNMQEAIDFILNWSAMLWHSNNEDFHKTYFTLANTIHFKFKNIFVYTPLPLSFVALCLALLVQLIASLQSVFN